MKKSIALIAFGFALCTANAQVTPQWPAAKATSLTISASGTTAITISNSMNYVATAPTLTADATVSLTASSSLKPGAFVFIAIKTTSTEATTFAGSIQSASVAGSAGKTWTQGFIYNGTKFWPLGAKQQVD